MKTLRTIWKGIRSLWRRPAVKREIDDELRFHIEQRMAENIAAGMSPEEAAREARRRFGNVQTIREECRDVRAASFGEVTWQDIRFGLRMLRKNPGFTAVAVLTLALGIGANTAIFSVINAVLLRPLPYPAPQEIVLLTWQYQRGESDALTARQFAFFRDHNPVFQAIAGCRGGPDLELKTGELCQQATAPRVSAGFFRVLGVNAALGRTFLPDEERSGAPGVLALSDGLWHRAFGGDPQIIGRQVTLNGGSYTIIGVLPRGFTFSQPADAFLPLSLGDTVEDQGANTSVLARLKAGVSLRQAQAGMAVVFDQYRKAYGAQPGEKGPRLIPFQQWLVGDSRPSLLLLFGAVGLLLLIACANVASLLLARTASRHREFSLRLALGAGRARLFRQFFSESLILGLAGGAAGLLTALCVLKVLVGSIPWDLPLLDRIRPDAHVLLFTLLLAVGSSVAFGLASFSRTLKLDLQASLKEGGTVTGYGAARSRLRNLFVVGQVAVSVILLIGAGLLIESLYRLHREKLGFEPENVLTMRTRLPATKYPTTASIWNLQQQALPRIAALPAVRAAAVVTVLPLQGQNNLPTQRQGRPEDSIGGMEHRAVSPAYFTTMAIPLLRGRGFLESDTQAAQPVAIISQTVAQRWWPGGNPLGDHIVVGMYQNTQFPDILEPPREIVGVVGDVKGMQLGQPAPPTVYVPLPQLRDGLMHSCAWVVRTSGRPPRDFATTLREILTQVGPDQYLESVSPMSQVVSRSLARPSFTALLMAAFAGLALALTAVGLYGLISYFVTQRTHEIGIRLALGAQRRQVLALVLRQGMTLALAGLGLGLLGALAFRRVLSSLLYQVKATDPATYVAVGLLLAAVALFACYVPARRAAKADPMLALRYE
jgi:putative ABC transport system permease protein